MLQYYFHVCMFRQSVVRKDRLSQSQVERKYFCSSHGFKFEDARRLKVEGTRLRGQLAVFLSCVSLVAHIGCRIVLVCSTHSRNPTKPTGP